MTIEGWLVVAVLLAVVAINTIVSVRHIRASGSDNRSATITFLLWLAIPVGALVAICWMTGEPPRWRRGN